MAFQVEKTPNGGEDLVISGWENGIASSPHKGLANIQNANISTETQEIMCSFARIQQSQTNLTGTGTLAFFATNQLAYSLFGFSLTAGLWITVSASSNTGELPNADYYIQISKSVTGTPIIEVSNYYGGAVITGFTAGLTANFTIKYNFRKPIASATEFYNNGTEQNRYYILDNQGLVWVYDTATANTGNGLAWFLPDNSVAYFAGTSPSGVGVLNGWLFVISGSGIYAKATVNLGGNTSQSTTWAPVFGSSGTAAELASLSNSNLPHSIFVGHQGVLYYTDGTYVGSIFPDSSLNPNVAIPNIQSFCQYVAITTTGSISNVVSGSVPWNGIPGTGEVRIPAMFFAAQGGTIPNALTAITIYYIKYLTPGNFEVYAASSGGSALNMEAGANGTQYFNTFWPLAMASSQPITFTFTPQRVNFPVFETTQCMVEIGNTLFIGCDGNIIYPWNQIDPTPSDLISLPESNVTQMVNTNNMAYIFAGFKGNIYITNGSVASLVTKIPDYCAGIAGTPSSYIEPYFVWGGAMYLRGRIYFSVQDQTTTKQGNCGGIWSFIPTQNFYVGQDVGIGLRLENQSSYGTYNGLSAVLIPSQNQQAIAPQYWNAWYSNFGSIGYGIDFTGTTPSGSTIIETDAIPTGTMLDKKTFKQVEYKLASSLASGETIELKYRQDLTSAFTQIAMINEDNTTALSGYFPVNFQKGQWLQIQIILNPVATTASSFCRFSQLRIR